MGEFPPLKEVEVSETSKPVAGIINPVKSDKIKEFVKRAPFAPFDIRTSDGRVYSVDHPEFLTVTRKGDTIVYITEDDRIVLIDCSQIVSFEISNRPTAA